MTNKIIQDIEKEQLKSNIPDFKAGDTIIVHVKVKEGNRQRLQAFEGVVIAKRNRGVNSSFTVRKISHGEGVERTFQAHSPIIDKIVVKRHGDVRKAKLYHLRKLSGRAARIKEKLGASKKKIAEQTEMTQETVNDVPKTTALDNQENQPAE